MGDRPADERGKTQTHRVGGASAGGGLTTSDGGADGSSNIRFSDGDALKLQQKRKKRGLCPKCGEIRTHRKIMMRLIPEVRCSIVVIYFVCI